MKGFVETSTFNLRKFYMYTQKQIQLTKIKTELS